MLDEAEKGGVRSSGGNATSSCRGVGCSGGGVGLVRPESGSLGVDGADEPDERERKLLLYSIISKIRSGCVLFETAVVTPAAVAISAAMSFVSIPPVPSFEPSVLVLTIGASV